VKLVYQSRAMLKVIQQARRFAKTGATVLICGESGTGKELIADVIHEESGRAKLPYVRVNCASLSESLVESELFGHEAGSFTGALARRQGKFEAAGRGTLFLDEISEVSVQLQSKLLRVLEEAEFERVGGNDPLSVQARIIAATNRPLSDLVRDGAFRADLFYRLDVLRLDVPPLRERLEDIPPLAQHFIQKFQVDCSRPVRGMTSAALKILSSYSWPGNIRQLRNLVHRACITAEQELIDVHDLPKLDAQSDDQSDDEEVPILKLSLADIERHVILRRLRECAGNKAAAAEALGVTSRTLRNKVNEYRRLGFAC
jgi:transcriptional regulator with PAS, ATPase and Fis domain